jgi:hypothetical protein
VAGLVLHLWVRCVGHEVVPVSTRCQIEFKCGDQRRTVYRHSDGYPSAVLPDLLEFLAWSTRGGDVEYEAANFLYWSKRYLDVGSAQLGFGICANDELHGDIEYYYVVEHSAGGVLVRAYEVEYEDGPRIGRCVDSLAVPGGRSFLSSFHSGAGVQLRDGWHFRSDRLRESRRCEDPHERTTFDELDSPRFLFAGGARATGYPCAAPPIKRSFSDAPDRLQQVASGREVLMR